MESLEKESGGERMGNGELPEDGEVLRVADEDVDGFEECPGVNETISWASMIGCWWIGDEEYGDISGCPFGLRLSGPSYER